MTTLAMIVSPVGAARSSAEHPFGRWAICGAWRSVQPRFHGFRPEAVAVVSPYEAWLVGGPAYDQGPPIALRWNGMSWVRTRVPLPRGVDTGSLNAVAVISPNDVWAVGSTFGRILPWDPFAVHWDGAAWHRVPIGRPRLRGSLEGLAVIPGTRQLWTVGYRGDTTRHTLILRWNGEAWHRVRSPDPSDHGNLLNDVVAVGDVAWAVGERYGPDTESTLMERWDGSAWKVVRAPNPGRTETTVIEAVDGLSPRLLWAVGYYSAPRARHDHGLILRWDGRRWSVARKLASDSALLDVTVASPTDAWAVGRYRVHERLFPLVVRRHVSPWARSPAPRPDVDHGMYFGGTDFAGVDGTPNNLWAALRIHLFERSYASTYHRC